MTGSPAQDQLWNRLFPALFNTAPEGIPALLGDRADFALFNALLRGNVSSKFLADVPRPDPPDIVEKFRAVEAAEKAVMLEAAGVVRDQTGITRRIWNDEWHYLGEESARRIFDARTAG